MKSIALAISCWLFASVAADADDAGTFNAMLVLAGKGDAEAQYHVGMMYNNGIGTQRDTRQAFKWFQKATSSNDPLGAYKLGCYYGGQGEGVVAANPEYAMKYKLIAANAGYSLAQFDVAVLLARQGDFENAVKLLRLAADQGHGTSLFALSSSYGEGKGVPKDLALAFAYFELGLIMSESSRTADARARLDGMLAQMSDAEIAKAKKIVEDWKPQPTALTIEAQNGISAAKEHLRNAK